MLANWRESIDHAEEKELSKELDELVLPSNEEWRHHVYYRLVDLQREIDSGVVEGDEETKLPQGDIDDHNGHDDDDENVTRICKEREFSCANSNEWTPIMYLSNEMDTRFSEMDQENTKNHASLDDLMDPAKLSMTDAVIEPGWRLSDILLAANVLQGNTTNNVSITYSDEAEMRRVYGLVYDVLRCKSILNQTLENADFWTNYGELRSHERIVWLLLYDMLGRKFTNYPQVAAIQIRNRIFKTAGLNEIEQALLKSKTKLAASVSRLRIGGSAVTLDHLLPPHLRNGGVCWSKNDAVASGWVNTIKIPTKNEFINIMSSLGLNLISDYKKLQKNNYAFDPICPKVIILHEKAREQLARSDLVRKHGFIFLNRSLCLGAAALARAIRVAQLCGPVILTHSMAPRHTGYLAGLLFDIQKAGRLLVFGAGSKYIEHEGYLEKLGIGKKICRVFAENYTHTPSFAEMERATVVLATPPCSYTGLKDIVDLVVARGGDMKLLESFTNIDDLVQLERPHNLLAEQMSSLKYALTRPNVQLLVYEAHSVLPSETIQMLDQLVHYANKMAIDKYTRELLPKRKHQSKDPSQKGGSQSAKSSGKRAPMLQDLRTKCSNENEKDDSNILLHPQHIEVPDSDLFEVGNIFDFHDKESKTTDPMINNGCYLAVVRRKEMMQFNSLFMIKVAESKGLFGDPNSKLSERIQESKDEHFATKSPIIKKKNTSKKNHDERMKSMLLDRITAPTHSSLLKVGSRVTSRESNDEGSSATISITSIRLSCPRYSDRIAKDERSINVRLSLVPEFQKKESETETSKFLIYLFGLPFLNSDEVEEISAIDFTAIKPENEKELKDLKIDKFEFVETVFYRFKVLI
ncbi:hypothetical protein PV327_002953 [Microctonus hyperodae]|uniref:Methyltransferase NSUN7 n=1 Tax=Microctonus hyperodae TaxID=165561 RepID=A0AA39G3U2_MICHY|nr:hypothetical protein PV327_002953 [Microctonus hyperodae]